MKTFRGQSFLTNRKDDKTRLQLPAHKCVGLFRCVRAGQLNVCGWMCGGKMLTYLCEDPPVKQRRVPEPPGPFVLSLRRARTLDSPLRMEERQPRLGVECFPGWR